MNVIDEFWKFFGENCTFLNEPPDRGRMDELLTLLNQIDGRLYYHLGVHNNGTDLILSAEGHPDLMPVLQNLEGTSPKIKGWKTIICYSGLALFGERDQEIFPDNVNGEALFQMYSAGDQLWVSRVVDFAVVFPDKISAASFSEFLPMQTIEHELEEYNGADGFTHEVLLKLDVVPTYKNITAIEQELANLAYSWGGRNDGWGCWQVSKDSDTG